MPARSPEPVWEVLLRPEWVFLRKSGGLGAGDLQLTKMDQNPSFLAPQWSRGPPPGQEALPLASCFLFLRSH